MVEVVLEAAASLEEVVGWEGSVLVGELGPVQTYNWTVEAVPEVEVVMIGSGEGGDGGRMFYLTCRPEEVSENDPSPSPEEYCVVEGGDGSNDVSSCVFEYWLNGGEGVEVTGGGSDGDFAQIDLSDVVPGRYSVEFR